MQQWETMSPAVSVPSIIYASGDNGGLAIPLECEAGRGTMWAGPGGKEPDQEGFAKGLLGGGASSKSLVARYNEDERWESAR